MRIEYRNIILRDMLESDIEDYVRWFTTQTQWSDADTPWEPIESDEETERNAWREYYESWKKMPDDVLRQKFEIEVDGKHVGWVSAYLIDKNYEWIGQRKEGQSVYRAVGIDICESDVWCKGIGTDALRAFVNYYFENGADEIYTQTWSGNARMLRCAEKLGFAECDRKVAIREVEGKKYDALTFRLENDMTKRTEEVELTNMCMICDGKGNVLVQDKKNHPTWHGWNFPGGHIEKREYVTPSVIREIFEETGLTIENPKLCGIKEFHKRKDGKRYIVFLYIADRFSGELKASDEGEIFWYPLSELPKSDKLIHGFAEMLPVFTNDSISEIFYERSGEEFKTVFC